MEIIKGVKKFGVILQKSYMPTKGQRLTKFTNKEAKKELEIKDALKLYQEKTNCNQYELKDFEIKLRAESNKPNKPIFENIDKAMDSLDKAFGKTGVREIKDTKKKYTPPKALQDPFGKSF